jgi:hypothetical protein
MKSIHFPEVTNKIGEKQEEFNTLEACWNPVESSACVCFELTEEEVLQMVKTKKIYDNS